MHTVASVLMHTKKVSQRAEGAEEELSRGRSSSIIHLLTLLFSTATSHCAPATDGDQRNHGEEGACALLWRQPLLAQPIRPHAGVERREEAAKRFISNVVCFALFCSGGNSRGRCQQGVRVHIHCKIDTLEKKRAGAGRLFLHFASELTYCLSLLLLSLCCLLVFGCSLAPRWLRSASK